MKLWGKEYTRKEYFAHVGNETQVFGIRPMEYRTGDENLVRTLEVDTGSGLSFSVGENKGMDIYRMSWRGVNIGFCSKAGLHSPYNVNPESPAFRITQGCGALYTAGITNVGSPCQDSLGTYMTHGNIKNSAASQVTASGRWEGDDYLMEISGDLKEAEFYGRNLFMNRTIRTRAGAKSFILEDRIENRSFTDDRVMILYHFNSGFPLLQENVRLHARIKKAEGLTPVSTEQLSCHMQASAPAAMQEEQLFSLELAKDAEGMSGSALWNEELGLGVYVRYRTRELDRFIEWKCMRAGDYALGMLPANCLPLGREKANRENDGSVLAPFETLTTHLEIGVLDGEEDLHCFEKWMDTMN